MFPLQKILLKIQRKATGWEEGNGPTKDNERQTYKKKHLQLKNKTSRLLIRN